MILNYIFDLYGTLVDIHTDETKACLWKRMALLLSLQGAPYGARALRPAYMASVREQIDKRALALPDTPKEHIEPDILAVFESLYAQKGVDTSKIDLQDAALFFRTLAMCHIRLYPWAREVLGELRQRGKGVYLLSNAQAAFTAPELHKLDLGPLFDGILLSSDAGVKKPDRAIFRRMLDTYGLDPETCVMVGNDAVADMQGAATVGMAGFYIHTKQSPDRQGSLPKGCREIGSLRELL